MNNHIDNNVITKIDDYKKFFEDRRNAKRTSFANLEARIKALEEVVATLQTKQSVEGAQEEA
jgi:polyhydroxyalkanoate synthesis regulator phasin